MMIKFTGGENNLKTLINDMNQTSVKIKVTTQAVLDEVLGENCKNKNRDKRVNPAKYPN
ncbi:hypothetical protein GCM10010917_34490 [Paenibacillus physcomitrellae]|uniref:Uncharacterized protein n=1 Tax=Paenibacillus physcomitrellae TaxID=1619311 RepID=A0ABQ1GLJ4_9BACL|nr:hypothetical protein GCM10010917_34490 [Paenibacillus physcomitrellae]